MTMYVGNIAPWEQYPKHLSFSEILDPLKVIVNFFSCGWPKDHKRDLKEWRHYVISEKHYKHRHGPGNLLFIYEQNIRMVEATHLLLLQDKDRWPQLPNASEEQIEQEKIAWVYFPKNLSSKELADPYRAINKCFKKISPQEYRYHLKEWLNTAMDNNGADEMITAAELIDVYDHMQKLYSAAWLIHQRETDRTFTHKSWGGNKEVKELSLPHDEEELTPLKDIGPTLSKKQTSVLQKITKLVVERMPGVSRIYLMGKSDKPSIYILLILIEDKEKILEHEIANKIEDHCRFLGTVFVIAQKIGAVNKALEKGDRFWHHMLSKSMNVYSTTETALLTAQPVDDQIWISEAERDWERWGKQGKEFMKGAIRYLEDNNYKLALFSFHQAAESSFILIIHAILGYRPSVHNLPRMIKITLLFTDEIKRSLQLNTTEGAQLFNLLQLGYSEARYKVEFEPDEQSVRLLKDTVQTLIDKIEQVYQQFIKNKIAP